MAAQLHALLVERRVGDRLDRFEVAALLEQARVDLGFIALLLVVGSRAHA
jgi:hypothetical protein